MPLNLYWTLLPGLRAIGKSVADDAAQAGKEVSIGGAYVLGSSVGKIEGRVQLVGLAIGAVAAAYIVRKIIK